MFALKAIGSSSLQVLQYQNRSQMYVLGTLFIKNESVN